jgi:hypothetical protein
MTRSFVLLAAALGVLGCSTGEVGQVKLGVDVAAIKIAPPDTTATGTSADAALSIDRVRVLVAHAKVGYIQEQATGASAEIGPIVVDLTADEIASGAHRDFDLGTLPTGTYGGAEIEIEPLTADDDQSSADVADFVAAGASVLVEGSYKGTAYKFAGHFLAEQGTDGDVTVDVKTPVSLALTVDTSQWFLDGSGTAVDPGDATQHGTLAVAMCKTLDTQPQLSGGGTPAAQPQGHGGKGGPGGGAHCIEAAQ